MRLRPALAGLLCATTIAASPVVVRAQQADENAPSTWVAPGTEEALRIQIARATSDALTRTQRVLPPEIASSTTDFRLTHGEKTAIIVTAIVVGALLVVGLVVIAAPGPRHL